MRTTVSISAHLLESAKRQAAARGITISAVIEDALRGHLASKRQIAPRPFRLHTVRGKLVNPDVDLDRTSALIAMDDEAAYGRK